MWHEPMTLVEALTPPDGSIIVLIAVVTVAYCLAYVLGWLLTRGWRKSGSRTTQSTETETSESR